ncbi:alcohol dehydrogenase catalytic domain-containing protein [Streptomyces sp. NPDC059849]|uniref:alcohol dehydrogenase catalytic domain-containing protein n=1 Tax=unclassified Streptomyces TaxID=2593676 RepID=UPI00364C5268
MVEVWRVPEWWAAEGGSESGAAGVNFKDICRRTGISAEAPPFVLGLEGAGTVEVLGEGVTGLAVGQCVAWEDAPGSYRGQGGAPCRTRRSGARSATTASTPPNSPQRYAV